MVQFGEAAPGLVEDYYVPNLFKEDLFSLMDESDRPPFRWLVIGPARSGASWHVDPALTSAWNTLLRGQKRSNHNAHRFFKILSLEGALFLITALLIDSLC